MGVLEWVGGVIWTGVALVAVWLVAELATTLLINGVIVLLNVLRDLLFGIKSRWAARTLAVALLIALLLLLSSTLEALVLSNSGVGPVLVFSLACVLVGFFCISALVDYSIQLFSVLVSYITSVYRQCVAQLCTFSLYVVLLYQLGYVADSLFQFFHFSSVMRFVVILASFFFYSEARRYGIIVGNPKLNPLFVGHKQRLHSFYNLLVKYQIVILLEQVH
jgi:hypothetical protein